MILNHVSKLPSVYILVMANVDIYGIVSTMKIEQLLQFSFNSNSVQSTVTNNKSIQQIVIDWVHMMPNPRITLFPYSNIQENLAIICYGTNDKNWNSDLY